MNRIRLGISTCPNDTFAFHALMAGAIDCEGLDFDVQLLDIQQLNDRLFESAFDVAKCSFHAALLLSESMVVLPCGSALGFGVGPLLLAAEPETVPTTLGQTTLCPGTHTTATLLFRLFYPETTTIDQVVFSEIMPSLQRGDADFGVCIHEGRFTWREQGLSLVEDLGTRWEQDTGCPLPLGGLVARKTLPSATLQSIRRVVRRSIEYGLEHPEEAILTMRRYAQEFDDDVLMQHVDLYVNDWTLDLGERGAEALGRLNEKAQRVGLVDEGRPGVQILATDG